MNLGLAILGFGLLAGALVYQVAGRRLQAANDKANRRVFGSSEVPYEKSSARWAAPFLGVLGVAFLIAAFVVG